MLIDCGSLQMKCPKCSSDNLSVIDSRGDDYTTRRRRECQACRFRFTTYERIERTLPMVVKKDGRREAFEREKVRGGIVKASEKRPVSMEVIDRTVEALEARLCDLCVKEISSIEIGDMIMAALSKIDKVAYVRFASVYREFSDPRQFIDTLESLKRPKSAKGRPARRPALRNNRNQK